MDALEAAAFSFQAGRVEQSLNLLQQVKHESFGPLVWYSEANMLACRMQILVEGTGGAAGLKQAHNILSSCNQLWHRMRGLSPSLLVLPAELSVLLSLCQLQLLLGGTGDSAGHLHTHLTTALERIRQTLPHSSSSSSSLCQTLSSLLPDLEQCFGHSNAVLRCVRKMSVMGCLAQAMMEEGQTASKTSEKAKPEQSSFAEAVSAHAEWLGGRQCELLYREGWLQYHQGNYNEAMAILSSSQLHPSPLSPHTHLLSGVCHARQGRLSLALCCWQRCLTPNTDHTHCHTHILAALQNCCVAYSRSGSAEAGLAMRRLEQQALRYSQPPPQPLPLWLWEEGEGGGLSLCPPTHRSMAEASYCLAREAWTMQNYSAATEAVQESISAVEIGNTPATPSFLPPPSSLHLLLTHTLLACQQWQHACDVCQQLLEGLPPSPPHHQPSSSYFPPLQRSEVMCLLAVAMLHMGKFTECRQWSHRTVEASAEEMVEGKGPKWPLSLALQSPPLTCLALLSITRDQWRDAVRLLAGTVITPTGQYNHTLLQCKLGHVGGGARGWLWGRRKWPGRREEGRKLLEEAKAQRNACARNSNEKNFLTLDIAMLTHWLQHHRQ